jgi:ribose-phosphate pyrophosphokinase
VTGIKRQSEKHLILASGRAFPELADEVASLLGVDLVPTRALTYANSEIYVRFEESVRGADAFVIQSHPAPVNEWLMEQLIMIDALKRASAKRITVVSPFYPYGSQDKKHAGREPISARLIADLYKTAGADRLMSIDLHASQIQGFFDGPVDHLWGLPVLADYVKESTTRSTMTVVSPTRAGSGWPTCGHGPAGLPRWRSSTSAATRTRPTRWRSARSSATSAAGSACWSTT